MAKTILATKQSPLYTLYMVREGTDSHRPYLLANNGKVPLNEAVSRAQKLEASFLNLRDAMLNDRVQVVRIELDEFRKRFPQFAVNKGGRGKAQGLKALLKDAPKHKNR